MSDTKTPTVTVTRRDFVKRAEVHLRCTGCGTTTIRCDLGNADLYEAGMREHVCKLSELGDGSDRPALRRMLRHMTGARS